MTNKIKTTSWKKIGKIALYTFIGITVLGIIAIATDSGAEEKDGTPAAATNEANATISAPALPGYTIVSKDISERDATYRVQVGDTLPSEIECVALAQKITGLEKTTTRNTAVFFTREGFNAGHGAHASVTFLKGKEAPEFRQLSASNAQFKAAALNTFDSIPGKQLVLECQDETGTKVYIYKKPSGEYLKVLVFSGGGYDIEPMKADAANNADRLTFYKTEYDERFTYQLNETGKTLNVYNENNTLINSMKVLSRG